MLKKILIAVVVIVVILFGVIAMQPGEFKVVRTATINAPPATVYALVNDFHKWGVWSPWEKLDPAMKRSFTGSPEGTGAIYSWSGNKDAGAGQMTIVESQPAASIRIQLDFTKPFASTNLTVFSFSPAGNSTTVEWDMSGKSNFMAKAAVLFMGGMDKMIGPDFDKGLAQLKAAAEATK